MWHAADIQIGLVEENRISSFYKEKGKQETEENSQLHTSGHQNEGDFKGHLL
jgi:hypothetical protein